MVTYKGNHLISHVTLSATRDSSNFWRRPVKAGQVFQISGIWTLVDGLDLISASEGANLDMKPGFIRYRFGYRLVWLRIFDLVSVPLSGSKLKLDDLTSISMSLILGSGIEFEKQLFGSLKHADYGRSSLFEHDI
ncbi:hypothetical protein RhiirA5_428258 [Rhizophagus irregularis]|uniref:Uncharacterized protein n=1 Tax=Rhizophagus irregularis TaxID=588596 RepID=A0A2N0P0N9_9GLOM|nr:hypothetical protein RhiirA5_428258 [Rhizophagus irregularis]